MRKTDAFRRAAALMAALSITVSLAAPAFAETYYYIDDGDITITKDENGQTVKQGNKEAENIGADEEIIITTHKEATTTLESDLEGPAAEDTGFGPVVEDNYQPAQPESTEEPEDADQPESTEEPKGADQPESTEEPKAADRQESAEQSEAADQQESADRQAQPQQAAPAAAPAASTPGNGFCKNIITVINKCADKVLNLTLKDVKIDVSDTGKNTGIPGTSVKGKAALSVQGKGNVEIELDGDNELKSGFNRAGLEKTDFTFIGTPSTGMLTLKDDNQKAGSLKATGGQFGAGIGGAENGNGKDITITGGSVTATGGEFAAGIGGGFGGSGENITINGGTVTADGNDWAAGIGGGKEREGENITITGGTVTAKGGVLGAGIGGGIDGSGSNVTVSGAAQVTATATDIGPDWSGAATGATIGGGGSNTVDSDGNPVSIPGTEIQADISGLTTGYIHHIIYEQDGTTIKKEWWEPERPQPKPENPQPNPEDPNAPAEESNEVDLGTPLLHVETLEGSPLPFDAQQQGSTLRVTSNTLAARLHGTRQALEALREQGVEQIEFVTSFKTTTLSVAELLAEGGSWFALEHNGLVSRQLSAAQAESLKCRMH